MHRATHVLLLLITKEGDEMSMWRHIITAPKDGTRVWIQTLSHSQVAGQYKDCRWVDDDGSTIRAPTYWAEMSHSDLYGETEGVKA